MEVAQTTKRKTGWSTVSHTDEHCLADEMVLNPDLLESRRRNGLVINELYTRQIIIAGVHSNISVNKLADFIGNCILAIKGNTDPGTPLDLAKYDVGTNTVRLTFRSAQEATNALVLDKIKFQHMILSLNRPPEYPSILLKVDDYQSITVPTTTGVAGGMLLGIPKNTAVNPQILGNAFSEVVSRSERVSSSFPRTVAGTTIGVSDAVLLLDLPPHPYWTDKNTIQLCTLAGPLEFILSIQKPSDEYLYSKLSNIGNIDYDEKPVTSFSILSFKSQSSLARLAVLIEKLELPGYNTLLVYQPEHYLAAKPLYTYLMTMSMRSRVPGYESASKRNCIIPTRCIYASNVCSREEVCDSTVYGELRRDLYSSARQFGALLTFDLIGPHSSVIDKSEVTDLVSFDDKKEILTYTYDEASLLGWVIIEFESVDEASGFVLEYEERQFNGKKVFWHYVDENLFKNKLLYVHQFKPNTSKSCSSIFNSELAADVPARVERFLAAERKQREAAVQAATRAASALLPGNVEALDHEQMLTAPETILSLTNEDIPDLNNDVDNSESDMEE